MSRIVKSFAASLLAVALVLTGGTHALAASPDPALTSRIEALMTDPAVTNATVGAVVVDADTGEEIYARNPDAMLVPASNMKMLTTAAALATLGPDYQVPTKVLASKAPARGVIGGNLYLKGFGDPTLTEADLIGLAGQLRASGVKKITGTLVADASFFDDSRYNAGWPARIFEQSDAAQVAALTVTSNADGAAGTTIVTASGKRVGSRATITLSPAPASGYVTIVNKTTTGRAGTGTSISVHRSASGTITVSGRVAVRSSASQLITVNSPALYAAAIFRKALAANGIKVVGKTTTGAAPAGAPVLQTHYSCAMSCVIYKLMKFSNNTQAEQVMKMVGATSGGQGTWASGAAVTKAVLAKAGIGAGELTIGDGSGQSYADRITPRALMKLLLWVRGQSWYGAWYNALPVAGHPDKLVGGTIRDRFLGTPAAYNLRAKTGTLSDAFRVTALSGYVTGRDGRHYAFVGISNYSGASQRSVVDSMGVLLAGWTKP